MTFLNSTVIHKNSVLMQNLRISTKVKQSTMLIIPRKIKHPQALGYKLTLNLKHTHTHRTRLRLVVKSPTINPKLPQQAHTHKAVKFS